MYISDILRTCLLGVVAAAYLLTHSGGWKMKQMDDVSHCRSVPQPADLTWLKWLPLLPQPVAA